MIIKKLLIVLFIVILFSSFIKYEHFYTFKLKFKDEEDGSVEIINNTSEPYLHIFLEYSNLSEITGGGDNACRNEQRGSKAYNLPKPIDGDRWKVLTHTGEYDLSEPSSCPNVKDPNTCDYAYTDLGIGSQWQKLSLSKSSQVKLNIPNFVKNCPFRIAALKSSVEKLNPDGNKKPSEYCYYDSIYDDNNNQRADCGQIIKIEAGKDIGANMSAVDGVNFKLKYEFTEKDTGLTKVIEFNTNPCDDANCRIKHGNKTCGCINPAKLLTMDSKYNKKGVPGSSPGVSCKDSKDCSGEGKMFIDGKGPGENEDDPIGQDCYHGTCNLQGKFKKWADDIHNGKGQCSNSEDTYPGKDISDKCGPGKGKGYTTYSYDYDDANSLPYLGTPYKIKLTYSDLN